MDSYPHPRNQMPISQYYHPGFEAVQPQMRMDPAKFPIPCESWPHGGNCGYPVPCHTSCNHSYFPGYYSCQSPYTHLSPPMPFHYHGSHPAFPEAYPVHYVSPPHYSMEQPRYEYGKTVPPNYHCCGCPNHMGNWKEDKNAKIEEQEPDSVKRGSDGDFVAPIDLKNDPYPVVWIPPGYLKNKDLGKRSELEVKDGHEVPHDTKSPESFEIS
ncbi:hypothetical protein L1049_013442 [Liquidambar formosana]|uniref:Uncharacterized protein n=1 Tax=Liquidambar formosana TaxID=63359 RepID=A0AAP0WYF4_LIQFO